MAGHRIGELTADDERRLGPYVALGTVSTGGWIMRITAYYRSVYDTNDCPGAQTKKVWSTDVLDGTAMVCMEVA